VTNSMVSGNVGLYGGIENVQTLTLTNSTLSGNQMMGSSSGGGAIEQHQVGSAPSATILNCTIVSNTASITNHSGIWLQAGTLNIGNSIVAQNGVTNNVKIDGGMFTSLGYNLTNSGAGTPFTATTDLVNTDPLLGPLQDHGGSSWTHALLPGSPAMDRIPNGVNGCGINLTNDQRGYARPAPTNGSCDIGAYEVQFTCRARIGTGVMFDSGDAAAVQNAVDAAPSGDIVRVAGTCAGVQFRAGAWQTVYITKPLILRGGYSSMNWTASDPVATPTILDARSGGYVVVLTGGTSLLQDLFMRNSPAFDKQAADRLAVSSGSAAVTPSITLENLTLRGGSMGGVLSNNADVTLSGMQIVSNTAHSGGGVNMSLSVITVTNSTVSKNMADGWGGGISNYRSRLTLVNSTISGNQSGGLTSIDGGGALDLYGTPDVTIVNSTIVNNTAVLTNAARSGIWLENGTLNIQNSVIAGNGVTNNVKIESSATFTSQGYNLTNSSVGTPFTATTDLINTNPLLGPLHNNGGSSWTHALLPGSPALNQIPNGVNGCGTTIITDQRGWPRPFPLGGKCDIGAFEAVFKVYLPLVLK
ncbi:MAG TPA: right-handed parallel beta-helix repeat-containing protein, partial [Anaerolineae bacterium]|nr:right-handed parallel beta-helix repeat-containing protein [Anaerolineae bacterium]